jgi:hypothetical protein
MKIRSFALPTPPVAIIGDLIGKPELAKVELEKLLAQRDERAFDLELLDKKIEFALRSICEGNDDSQDVENYDGELGVSKTFVADHEAPVGQLQWLDDVAQRFSGANEKPGTVSGERWGTGALIGPDLFLTAGHCFDQTGDAWVRPSRGGKTILPEEIATLMRVNFRYQVEGGTTTTRPGIPFPVLKLREHRLSGLDYAIVQLGADVGGKLPGARFGWLTIAAADLKTPGSTLCIIQHLGRRPKRVATGTVAKNASGIIRYNDLDAGKWSSGAPILSVKGDVGEVVGVHLQGGCLGGGANTGQAIGVIRAASDLI